MTNNDVLRRIRYTFDLKDQQVISIFALTKVTVSPTQVNHWLRKDDDDHMVLLEDHQLSSFLNGFIIEKRGKRDGDLPKADKVLSKNLILMKLKIALNLQAEDIITMLKANNLVIGKSELSAFFRKPEHKNYRHCKAQFLRNFLQGIDQKFHVKRFVKPQKPITKTNTASGANSSNKTWKKNHSNNKKATESSTKTLYVNPKAAYQDSSNAIKNKRKTLKLKPSDIYKEG